MPDHLSADVQRQKSLWTTALPITLFSWPIMARIARAAVINVKDADFVLAVRALGASRRNIVFRHILPNSIAPIITTAIFSLSGFIALEATLSYLGYQPPDTRHQMVYDLGMPASVLSWANALNPKTGRQ
ncbi:ABC transporter permease subunit [Arthrobacter russicus]|uniref:ABC transporter permease subunit n=1 Tax=Arthrobacter russicus TaxID=172040 RepID=UPI0031E08096